MTREFSFNLVDQPWLPCVRLDRTTVTLSLRETLVQAHNLQSLAVDSPPQKAALHRFLLAILHRVFGPSDSDEWEELWSKRRWDEEALAEYFERWQHRFDLFDQKRPFYQAADDRVREKSTISLSHDRASGNNPTLFDHHTEELGETLTPAEATRALITAQAYGLAGLSGIKQTFTDGACAGGIIFLVDGDSLWETQMLNMLNYPTQATEMAHTPDDRPVWEMDDPFTPNREQPLGYLDYLTWQNRHVLFQPEEIESEVCVRTMTMAPALRLSSEIRDPMKMFRPDSRLGHVAISFSEDRALWRDSTALFSFPDEVHEHYLAPMTFRWLKELVDGQIIPRHKIYRTLALGMSKRQAKVFFFREESLPLPLSYLSDSDRVSKLATAIVNAEEVATALFLAIRRMGTFLQVSDAEGKKWSELSRNAKNAIYDWVAHTGAERDYWTRLDVPFQSLVVDLTNDPDAAQLHWQQTLREAAREAFERAAQFAGNDGRSFKAMVRGRGVLTYRLTEILPVLDAEEVP